MKIQIIAAALPPVLDGIGDYTACLATELAHSAAVTVLTGTPHPSPICGVRVETAFLADDPASVRQIARFVEADRPDWVLLQYNPFCYGRWGLNLHLPETLRGLRRVSPGTRLAVMVHEPFVPTTTPQFAVMAVWQRWQLWRLGRSADVVFFSIETWQRRFRHWFPGRPVLHLPVGSNIPRVPISRAEARRRLGIPETTFVLGLFGSMHVSRLLNRVRAAALAVCAAGSECLVLYLGPSQQAVRDALGNLPMLAGGPFPAPEISCRFAAMDVHLTPFDDGISTRRGSVLCGLQHGIPTVGTLGANTDGLLRDADGRAFLLVPASSEADWTAAVLTLLHQPALRAELASGAEQLYQENFTWPRIAARLLAGLPV